MTTVNQFLSFLKKDRLLSVLEVRSTAPTHNNIFALTGMYMTDFEGDFDGNVEFQEGLPSMEGPFTSMGCFFGSLKPDSTSSKPFHVCSDRDLTLKT